MKLYVIIISILTVGLQSCADKKCLRQNTHQIESELSSFILINDSLSIIFNEEEFKITLDTFRFEGTEQPMTISLIEYYGSGYTVFNIKCMLSGYSEVGLITLFKYNSSPTGWEKVNSKKVSLAELKRIISELENSPYWMGKYSPNDTQAYMLGDLVRYVSFNGQNEDIKIKMVENPNANLYNMFVKITQE